MTRAQRKEKESIQSLGGNIKPLKDMLVSSRDKIISLKAKRGDINAEIKAVMEHAESNGIPKKSLRAALNYWESTTEQREGYHEGYNLCLEAWGMPVGAKQSEMFNEGDSSDEIQG